MLRNTALECDEHLRKENTNTNYMMTRKDTKIQVLHVSRTNYERNVKITMITAASHSKLSSLVIPGCLMQSVCYVTEL
jgi:hypothetical protein